MKISIRKLGPDHFGLLFDGQQVMLNTVDLTLLLTEATRALHPGAAAASSANPAADFAQRLRSATDVGVQALMRTAAEDDLLILLKLCERDQHLTDLLLRNMSDRARKMMLEDLGFKFRDHALSPEAASAALARLAQAVKALEHQGVVF